MKPEDFDIDAPLPAIITNVLAGTPGYDAHKKRMQEMADNDTNLLPCGHAPEVEDDRIIDDECRECGWKTPYRALSHKVNDAAADRGNAEAQLISLARATDAKDQLTDDDFNEIVKQAIRVGLKFGREEALRHKLNNLDEE